MQEQQESLSNQLPDQTHSNLAKTHEGASFVDDQGEEGRTLSHNAVDKGLEKINNALLRKLEKEDHHFEQKRVSPQNQLGSTRTLT